MSLFWSQRIWMMLGALAAATGALTLMLSERLAEYLPHVDMTRVGQIQIVHAMATISCATFINAGAVHARRAPPFFLGGILCAVVAVGWPSGQANAVQLVGAIAGLALVTGWVLLIVSTKYSGRVKISDGKA